MDATTIAAYDRSVPRYTSYPTAPHFHEDIDCGKYAQWLQAITGKERISLYVHVPYCDRLCWFCACHTKHTLKYEPIAIYLESLKKEIAAVGAIDTPEAEDPLEASSKAVKACWTSGAFTSFEKEFWMTSANSWASSILLTRALPTTTPSARWPIAGRG